MPASSRVNPETCSGCTQCVLDCPYEAISMHPHTSGKRLLASVDPALCVSCAICAASCDDHAIGPPNRTAIEQIARTKAFLQEGLTDKDGQKVVVLACGKNGRMLEDLRRLIAVDETICLYPVDCCGTIHSEVLETLLSKCAGAMLLGCPVGNCINRDGLRLVRERIFEKRVPFLHRSIERSRLSLCAFSDKEAHLALSAVQHLRSNLVKTPREREAFKEPWLPFFLRRTVATAVVLGGIAAISQFLYGSAPNSSIFRVAVQIPGRAKQECRPLTAEEKAKLPMHMQRPEICDSVSLDYRLSVMVDRLEKSNKVFTHRGVHGDSPILIHDDIHVSGGRHDFEIALAPLQAAPQNSDSFTYKGSLDMEVGRIYLLRYEHTSNSLELAP
ncbi:MAG: hypothetical protein DCC75_06405 [Proteobacteria bacterium]|nr:MAG: hypothetical protein DCC75_06405 [Pseudomonadota bacterium]